MVSQQVEIRTAAGLSKRIAEHGYVVLTPNIFYRTTKPPAFDFEPDFASQRTMNRFRELTTPLTPDAMASDGSAFIDFLSTQPRVSGGPMGVVGFCFAGQLSSKPRVPCVPEADRSQRSPRA